MKIAIISDIHNNEVNLKKALEYSKKEGVKNLICCGDLASRETLDFLADNFSGEIFFTFGNMDDEHMPDFKYIDNYRNVNIFAELGSVEFDKQKVAFVHYPEVAKKLARTKKFNFVFYGHTHKPWEEIVGECKVLNPGCITGDRFQPTFAIWDTKKDDFELVLLNEIK